MCIPVLALGKKPYPGGCSITKLATLVSIFLFGKANLKELLTLPNDKHGHLNSNQNVKELTLFKQ